MKIFRFIGIITAALVFFVAGLYTYDPIFDLVLNTSFGSFLDGTCEYVGWEKYDVFDKSCFSPLCCEPIMVYTFYLLVIALISFSLLSRKQKLPAVLVVAFGIGIIFGTFMFYLVMP